MLARSVINLEEEFDLLELIANRRDARGELCLIDQGFAVAVVDDMSQFRLEIAVIDIDGADACFEGPELGLHILRRIIGIDCQLRTGLQSMVGKHLCDARCAIFIFGPAIAFIAVDDCGFVRNCCSNIFPDIGHLPGHAILSLFFSNRIARSQTYATR